jgi:hypothetical protein
LGGSDTKIRGNKQNCAGNDNCAGYTIKAMRFNSFNWEGDSNESDSQDEKHSEQRISTLDGITID